MTWPRIKLWQILAGLGLAGIVTYLFAKPFAEGLKLPSKTPKPYGPEKPKLRWPFDKSYPIISYYGNRKDPFDSTKIEKHNGIDISVVLKTPVRAMADWKCVETHKWNGTLTGVNVSGNYVKLEYPGGIVGSFVHLYSFNVKLGQTGQAGDIVALSGSSGKSQGPHLHITTRVNGVEVDPLTVMPVA